MEGYKTLQNLTDRSLSVVFQGKNYVIAPRGKMTEAEDVVQFAKGQFGNFVTELKEQETFSYVDEAPPTDVYVANMTGDPDAPLEFVVGRKKDKKTGEYHDIREPNENYAAQIFETSMGQKQVLYEGSVVVEGAMFAGHGHNTKTVLGRLVRLLPYQRVKVTQAMATELIRQDAQRPRLQRGKVVLARAPGGFEPKRNWPLDQKRAWLELADHSFRKNPKSLGATEAELRDSTDDKDFADKLVAEADEVMWGRCFQRFVRPEVSLPTEKDFEIYSKSQKELKAKFSKKVAG